MLLISAGAIEGHFEGKTPREDHQEGLVLARQSPAHRELATQKKLAYLGFHVLITNPILRIWPRRTTTCSLELKKNGKFAIFRPTRRSSLPRGLGSTDSLLILF